MTQSATARNIPFETQEKQSAEVLVEKLIAQFGEQILVIVLFGSRARGDAHDESDMDILIIMSEVDSKTRRQIRFLATEIWLEHGIFLSTYILSLTHWRELQKLSTALYQNIREDGLVLFQQSHLDEFNASK